MEQRADLVVVGGGMAGVTAALVAADAGLSVTLLEKMSELGGSSAMSGGVLAFAGTDLQRAAGIEDSPDLLRSDLLEVGEHENDPGIVDAYVSHQLETFEWLRKKGAIFSPRVWASSGQSVPRSHTVDPAEVVRQLARLGRATGRVEILRNVSARELIRESVNGRVEGVLAQRSGELVPLHARCGVLLTCGGFSQNPDLIRKFVPGMEKAILNGGEGNTGDGLRMAWRLGADVRDMSYIKGTFGKHPVDKTNIHTCLAVYKGAIAVNDDGERFVDESISYKLLGDACLKQPNGCSYQILDQGILDQGDETTPVFDFGHRVEQGLMLSSETLAGLAAQLEIPLPALSRTVAEYNEDIDAGADRRFGRRHVVHNYGDLKKIERAPFYAYPSTTAVFGTYCGLATDPHARVIDVFGQCVAGLYAAGEVMGGFHGGAYMTGSALGKAAVFGRIAAQTASSG
jgi:fumarate reductase flavoprotein subunit